MKKLRNYAAYDFYTHDHSEDEIKATKWLDDNGFTWQAYGRSDHTIFRATKDGITMDLYIYVSRTSHADMDIALFEKNFNFAKELAARGEDISFLLQ